MALRINERIISGDEIGQRLKVNWRTNPFVEDLVHQEIIAKYAKENNITVSPEELQEGADAFRMGRGLYTTEKTRQWLADNNMTLDEFEETIRHRLLKEKIFLSFPEDLLEKHFAENQVHLDAAEIYMLVTEDQTVAKELKAQLVEEDANFMVLAKQHSTHLTAKAGGYVGWVHRQGLAGEVAAAVFGAKPNAVLGPFKTTEGYTLIHVTNLAPASLNAQTERKIRQTLFDQWISKQAEEANIEWVG